MGKCAKLEESARLLFPSSILGVCHPSWSETELPMGVVGLCGVTELGLWRWTFLICSPGSSTS